jgi:hypothetical protein
MSIETLRGALGWCAVINYGVLLFWFLALVAAHDAMHRFHGRWFHLTAERFDAIHYTAMGVYKIGIILFNLAPYAALLIVA